MKTEENSKNAVLFQNNRHKITQIAGDKTVCGRSGGIPLLCAEGFLNKLLKKFAMRESVIYNKSGNLSSADLPPTTWYPAADSPKIE